MNASLSDILPPCAGYVMVADDDPSVRSALALLLKRVGLRVVSAATPAEVLSAVRDDAPALILMDMNFSGSTSGDDGLELIAKVKVLAPSVAVILITAWGSIPLAVEGMRLGAADFLTKPWRNDMLLKSVATALQLRKSDEAVASAAEDTSFDRSGIIGESPALRSVLDTVRRVAATDAPVLLLGENGTGKELIAQAIHRNSRRRAERMVSVNLGGIPTALFESEMFGYVKGAFTGAADNRKGRFELADKGTIFLDEIGELDQMNQVKLLRVLQEHTFEPLGDSRTRRVDFRVVAATNADLPKMVASREFREDLFYRINLITVNIPPLRERTEDIPLLAEHFARMAASANGLPAPEFSAEALGLLTRLPYPGNIRELRNRVERAIVMHCGGDALRLRLEAADFDDGTMECVVGNAAEEPLSVLEDMERRKIETVLEAAGGNVSRAAVALGVTRQSLYRKITKYGIGR